MNEHKTTSSILQRVPVILAVTAASYGLQMPLQLPRLGPATTAAVRADAAPQAQSARVLPGSSRLG